MLRSCSTVFVGATEGKEKINSWTTGEMSRAG
jgi:hypothetical protein